MRKSARRLTRSRAALILVAPLGSLVPHAAAAQAALSVTCKGIAGDVTLINDAVGALGGAGGEIYIQPGRCFFGSNETVNIFSNTWLRGASPNPGGTTFFRESLSLVPFVKANNGSTMYNVTISDFAIEDSDIKYLSVVEQAPVSPGANELDVSGYDSNITQQMVVVDATTPGAIQNNTTVSAVSADGRTATLSTAIKSPGVKAGDTLFFYPRSSDIDAEWITRLTINNVHIVKAAAQDSMVIQGVNSFVLSNNFVSVTDPDPLATGTILLTGRTVDNPPWNHNGFVVGNVVLNACIEVGGTNVVLSYNVITPGFGTGIVSEAPAPNTTTPISANNIFEHNTVHFGQVGLNHDGIVAGGMEIWDTKSLLYGNELFQNGAQGALVGGPGTRVAENYIWDNGTSPYLPNGGNSGLDLQTPTAVGDTVAGNFICNTGTKFQVGVAPTCLASQNHGSQMYSMYVGPDVTSANIAADNEFLPGNADGSGVLGTYVPDSAVSEGTISATPCVLPTLNGTCQSSIRWLTKNATNVTVLVSSSAAPGTWQSFGSGSFGSSLAPWIGNGIYVFELVSDQGVLASATVQPAVANLVAPPMATAVSIQAPKLANAGATVSVNAAAPAPPMVLDFTAHTLPQTQPAEQGYAASQLYTPASVTMVGRASAAAPGSNPLQIAQSAGTTVPPSAPAAITIPPVASGASVGATPSVGMGPTAQSPMSSSETQMAGGNRSPWRTSKAMVSAGPGPVVNTPLVSVRAATPTSAISFASADAGSPRPQCDSAYRIVTASADHAVLRRTLGGHAGTELVTAPGGMVAGCGKVYTIAVVGQRWAVATDHGSIY